MKKLLLLLSFVATTVVSFSQGQPFPNYQPEGNPTTRWSQQGAVQGIKGLINGVYQDTTFANLGYIDFYPGAQIFTTNDKSIWVRDNPAYRWIKQSPTITNFTFLTDSSIRICFGNDVCDTLEINNFTNVVNNIVNNFVNNSVTNIGDSILIICNQSGSCDTIHIDEGDNYFFLNDSTIIVCDSLETICVGDSCYVQQICDTIPVPRITSLHFDEGVARITPGSNIVKLGDNGSGWAKFGSNRQIDAYAYNLLIKGQAVGNEPLSIQQRQLPGLSSSIQSWNHLGSRTLGQSDYFNTVNLSVNYTDRLYADSMGFMYNRIGYMLMTNSTGNSYYYQLGNEDAKQTGIMFHTTDTSNTDAVTIFGNQVPSAYPLANNPQVDSTLFDSRIAVFKTSGQLQLPKYVLGAFENPSPLYIIVQDADGNIGQYPPGGGGGGILINANNGLSTSTGGTIAVLGQNEAEGGNPGILLNNREVPMGGFYLTLNASATQAANIFQTKNAAAAVRARITSAASFSNTGGQSNSEIFGDGASVGSAGNTALGKAANARGQNNIAIGNNAETANANDNVTIGTNSSGVSSGTTIVGVNTDATSGGRHTLIGSSIQSSSGSSVGVGYGITLANGNNIAIGEQANVQHNYSQGYGFGATTTAANQVVFGSSQDAGASGGANDIYWGEGVLTVSPNNVSLNANSGSGNNVAGGSTTINASRATGNAAGGGFIIQTSDAGASGSTLQTLTPKFTLLVSGETRLNKYGIGSFTSGTGTYLIATKADGSLMEFPVGGLPGGGNLITANNGLTATTATNVQLGSASSGSANSPLLHKTYINTASFESVFYGESATLAPLNAFNASGGIGLSVLTSSGTGVYSQSNSGFLYHGVMTNSNQNSVIEVMKLSRETTGGGGVGQVGIGESIGMYLQTSTTAGQLSNRITSKYTTVTHGAQISQLDISGVNAAVEGTIASFYGSGVVGIGISSSYTATRLDIVDNSVAGAPIVNITSTSTAAAGNNQKGINVSLTGTNTTAGLETYAGYFSNTHNPGFGGVDYAVYATGGVLSGSGSFTAVRAVGGTNGVGVHATATNSYAVLGQSAPSIAGTISGYNTGSGAGVYGENTAGSGYGVYGVSTSNVGVYGQGNSSYGVQGTSVSAAAGNFARETGNSAGDASVVNVLRLERTNSNTIADGVGGTIEFYLETSSSTQLSNQITSAWPTSNNATRTSKLTFSGVTSGTTQDWLILGQSGYLKLRPMTVTEAGAIATAEGLIVFVSNTDATFTSVGIWIYQNGAWKAL